MSLSQSSYIAQLLVKFQLTETYECSTPLDVDVDLYNPDCEDTKADEERYLSMVVSRIPDVAGDDNSSRYCVRCDESLPV